MALQVWLPLTKDLRNQGLSDVTVTNNGATFNSAGKLGGCYIFGSGKWMTATPSSSAMQAKAVSVACWVKITSWNNSYDCLMSWADGTGWINSRVNLARNNTNSTLRFTIADGSNYAGVNCTTALTTNIWYHVVGTYDGSNIKIYINGNLEGTAASTISIAYAGNFNIGGWSGNNYPINGSLNDVRIYNHCLSEMEVKELAKGLVLHYPLNRNGWGQENLAHNTYNLAPWSTSQVEFKAYNVGVLDVSNGETITISFDLDMTVATGGSGYLQVYNTNYPGPHQITAFNALKGRTLISGQDIHERISHTTTMTTRSSYSYDYDTIEFYSDYSTENEIQISNIKIERGSIATPWCPNSSDALATTMGLDSTIEYDCSGFCNNGTRSGTFTWTSDAPKYCVSTSIEKGIINSTNSFVTTADPVFSVALWFKLKSGVSYTSYTDLISFSSSSYSNQPFRLEICGSPVGKEICWFRGPSGQSGGFRAGSNLSFDTWYHTVLVSEGNKQYTYYLNGEKKGTYNGSANTWTPTGNVSLGENINGVLYESDFRVYATALSATDIKSLYQNCATIGPDGTIYGKIR